MRAQFFGIALVLLLVCQTNGILKGKRARADEVYFMVALYDKVGGNLTCGGVIIFNEWILTAASCAQNPVGMWAVAGSFFTASLTSDKWQRHVVDYGITHEKYVVGEPHYDIALLHVSEPYVWTEFVRPAELPLPGVIPTGEVNFFGYGQISIGFPKTSLAPDTQRLTVNILDWNECRKMVPQDLVMDDRMVCTEQEARQSFCREDVGGPLVILRTDELPMLVGIAAWSYLPCGMSPYPNVYTQVSMYLQWIGTNMRQD